MTSTNDLYCGCCGGSDQAPPKGQHGACCAELHSAPARCRTCGFTDCPGATVPGGCTRWPGTEAAPAAALGQRPGLIADGMPEDTPSARRLGAYILGRLIVHGDELYGTVSTSSAAYLAARALGFTVSEANIAADAHRELRGF